MTKSWTKITESGSEQHLFWAKNARTRTPHLRWDDVQVHPSVRVKMHTPPLTERCTLETNPALGSAALLGILQLAGWLISMGKSIYKWMITRGSPILGSHQMGMELEVEFPSRMGW